MLDFLMTAQHVNKKGVTEIYPNFKVKKSKDLMIRGRDFYAIWVENRQLWSTDEDDVIQLIDSELDAYADKLKESLGFKPRVLYMHDSESGMIDCWHKYCQKQMRDNFHMLDERLVFPNTVVGKEDYASKCLPYPLEAGPHPAYEKLISTLYSPEERHKIEWAIGSVISGDSKKIQKFMVLYGAAGTGKSTVLNIIQQLFDGYYSVFDAKALGFSSNSFALEAFRTNPLVAIQHDGDLSRIEDNTRLNSLVSHEIMTVNEKFKSVYENRFKSFLFMGTNKPVKITDAKSGLIRRLIDVAPTGEKLNSKEYKMTTKQIQFELGAIAAHCLDVYSENPSAYDDYIPIAMLGASNDFYNFMIDSYHIFNRDDGTTLKAAWEMYKVYCDDAKVNYPLSQRNFKEELKNYFWDFKDRLISEDGSRLRSCYSGFRKDKFEDGEKAQPSVEAPVFPDFLSFTKCDKGSTFDEFCCDCTAQYANASETPLQKWDDVTTKLSDLNPTKLHYVKVPTNHIVIDFDLRDADGNKSFELNRQAASTWPPTYAELSKGGAGIHLHYIYSGDVTKLSRVFDDSIEIKVFVGNSALRRRLSRCNNLMIALISSGLPLKGDTKVVNWDGVKNEKILRTMIKRNLNKEYHSSTKPSVDYICKLLNDAYDQGLSYDVSDMKNAVIAFAAGSTNNSDYCIKLANKMHFKSDEPSANVDVAGSNLVFFDCEVFPNLFLVNWKVIGEGRPIVRMINPTPKQIEDLLHYKLIGFNCRRYDNHMLYACMIGYTNEQLFDLSQKIVNSHKGAKGILFGEAYNLSFTDIYDFASAGNKKSLKKLEIEMGIHHQELGLPWDKPVPKELWAKVAEYCDNDVTATEATFNYLKGDWLARKILADISGMTVNDTTNSLSTRIIFGTEKEPQGQFNYRNLALPVPDTKYEEYREKFGPDYVFRVFDESGLPLYRDFVPGESLPKGYSILPFFKGYTYDFGKSIYMDEEIGEGGKVYAEPGMYTYVWDADVTGQHPSSILAEVLFGPKFTKAFKEIVDGRVSIKHKAWDVVDKLFDGKLQKYVKKVIDGELSVKELANALKTVVNSVYGLTSASFTNPFRDPRNVDNIVAKRGALFMTLLKSEVQKRGFTVCHIKTDSIKIPNATEKIKQFVLDFGKEYGYSFETEADYAKFCVVNDAVYIAKTREAEIVDGKEVWWHAIGKQFAVPYVFKTLFSKEPIIFDDMCETFAVSKGDLYLDMNETLPDVSSFEAERDKRAKAAQKAGTVLDLSGDSGDSELDNLIRAINQGHDLQYIGRVGQFTPIKKGHGGGILYRVSDGKNYAASCSTGYRWLESEIVRGENEQYIDKDFYRVLVDGAVDTISKYGDVEWFISDDVPEPISPWFSPDNANDVPWFAACGKDSCTNCESFIDHGDYSLCLCGYDISDFIEANKNRGDGFEKR